MNFKMIHVRELEHFLNNPDVLVIDLRDKADYELFHFRGAKNVPYNFLEQYKQYLPKDKAIVLYCEHGSTSLKAARKLGDEGYQVYTVTGGIRAFEERKLDE